MSKYETSTGLDKASFARAVLDRLKARNWPGTAEYVSESFEIRLQGDVKLYLDNSYADWLAASDNDARANVVDRLVSVAFQSQDSGGKADFNKISDQILPAVRSRDYIQNLWMALPDFPKDYRGDPNRPLCDWLTVTLTINSPTSIETVSADQLKKWGKTYDELMTVAMTNLAKVKAADFQKHPAGFYFLNGDDYYDPSVLLMPSVFMKLPLKGAPVAVAVTRTLVVVADANDPQALQAMANVAEEEYSKDPRAISYWPLILKNGAWQSFDGSAEIYPMLRRLQRLEHLAQYRNQLAIMGAYNKRVGRDVYVGQLEAIEDGKTLTTWSSLVSGIETLLPQSDVVIVAPADLKKPFVRRFGDLMKVAGQVTHEPDTWPPLYVFKTGLTHDLSEILHDKYPQPTEFPDIGKAG